ncbi:MAG: hydroxyacylglutathione hydrolase [Proteobacteria bacterium]|nr:MAG: hydroxyacylglutathione hydrolase [Pseudomonadota bacterium]
MIQVISIPAFTDNYIWLMTNEERKHAAIVDPGDAQVVIAELTARQMQPLALLITHHHRDHVGGIEQLCTHYPELKVYGPRNEVIPHLTQPLQEGDSVTLDDLGLRFEVLDVPGHTAGHIAYFGEDSLFCGDTLFGSGCGRVFDGSMEDLFASLQKLASLPAKTLVYCAHEYTVDNLGFAKWVEPENSDIDERLENCWDLLDSGRATVPFTLEGEFATNPFLRTHVPELIAKAEEVAKRDLKSPAEVFATLRIWKDTEYD